MNNRLLDFNLFINESSSSFKEGSSSYNISERWDGGYDIRVCDSLLNGDRMDESYVNIAKKTEKAVALAYVKSDGKHSEYLWIPSSACFKKKYVSSSGAYYPVEIPSYTYWFKDEANRRKLENFLNDFMDSQELKKRKVIDDILEQSKDDLDLILDQVGLNDAIASLERGNSDYQFEGITENGLNVIINKRSKEDLVGDFEIYPSKKDTRPAIRFSYTKGSNQPSFIFNIDGKNYQTSARITEVENSPYLRYLILRSLNKETQSDKDGLLNYYTELLKSHDWNYQYSDDSRTYKAGQKDIDHINEVGDLLKEFMPEKEVSDIYLNFSNKK
jgi:hypothetical protein